ncbi:MAG: epoxide hydrolase, soluble (sEH) [Pycnora praestabilis]|nr:MAG: epoxide hydrolase, soluble (sEH) [Pycnora praestabilis]
MDSPRPIRVALTEEYEAPPALDEEIDDSLRTLLREICGAPPASEKDIDCYLRTLLLTHLRKAEVPTNTLKEIHNIQRNIMGMAIPRFDILPHHHEDLVQAVHYNKYGTRLVTGSSDHRLKVWEKNAEGIWILVDTWRGHDAEIMDVKWNDPFMGTVIGSVGEDGKFKIWEEDVTEAPESGRRFKCIYSHSSPSRIPYVSLDFKTIKFSTVVALISRDGSLDIYEPTNKDNFSEWQRFDHFQTCSPPARGEDTGFKVRFHQDALPCYTAITAGLDKLALSLLVGAMDTVKIYRTNKDNKFYTAAEIAGHRGLVRDIDWANGSARGTDVIATASKDGAIRIFEVSTPLPSGASYTPPSPDVNGASATTDTRVARSARSGIGAGLADASRVDGARRIGEGEVKHHVREVGVLTEHHGAVWRLHFDHTGNAYLSNCSRIQYNLLLIVIATPGRILGTMGDDGKVRQWKKAVDGQWMEFAQISPESAW